MPKKKLIHFQENLSFPYLFQPSYHELPTGFHLKESWKKEYFKNIHPVTLELGCGKGEYTIGLAAGNPAKNFIGIDLKGARLWRGCKCVEEQGLTNVAFIRSRIDHIEHFFGKNEISEIWITFPDPQRGKARKRLTSPVFLDRYKKILCSDNMVHLKTDDQPLYEYTLEVVKEQGYEIVFSTDDLYNSGFAGDASRFRTFYESMWLEKGKNICYLQFKINI